MKMLTQAWAQTHVPTGIKREEKADSWDNGGDGHRDGGGS